MALIGTARRRVDTRGRLNDRMHLGRIRRGIASELLVHAGADGLEQLAGELRERLVRDAALPPEDGGDAAQRVAALVEREAALLSEDERATLRRLVTERSLGLGPLEPLLADPVGRRGDGERSGPRVRRARGRIEPTEVAFASEADLRHAIERILAPLGRRVDEAEPLCDARLADGSRVNVVIPPLALDGPLLTIRRFRAGGFGPDDLVANGTLDRTLHDLLAACVRARLTMLVSGGTGSGKTTTLGALSSFIPDDERIVTIEDAAELRLRQPHVVRLEARPASLEGRGEVTIRRLVRNALRMRPDRIVVGEVRGGEALDMLSAMASGHDGSLSTVHAGSPEEALRRVETLALMADVALPHAAVRELVAGAIDLVVQQRRERDGRAADRRGERGAARGRRRRHARAVLAARRARRAGARRCPRRWRRGWPTRERGAARRACGGARRARAVGRAGGGRARWRAGTRSEAARAAAARAARRRGAERGGAPPARARRDARAARGRLARAPDRSLGAALAAGGPWGLRTLVRRGSSATAGELERAAPAVARAVADALAAGHAISRALAEAARSVDGRRGGGAGRARTGARRRPAAGGGARDAAGARGQPCLRHARDRDPAAARRGRRPRRAAARAGRVRRRRRPAARTTRAPRPRRRASPAVVVGVLPAGAAALAELASPGALAAVLRNPLALWLAVFAGFLQLLGLLAIRRLGRVTRVSADGDARRVLAAALRARRARRSSLPRRSTARRGARLGGRARAAGAPGPPRRRARSLARARRATRRRRPAARPASDAI